MSTPLARKGADPGSGTVPGRGRRANSFGRIALALDLIALSAGAAAVAALSPTSSPTGHVPSEPLGWMIVFSVLVLVLFRLRGMYTAPLRLELTEALREIVSATAIAAVLTMAARVLTTNEAYVAAETVRHWAVVVPLLLAGRGAVLLAEGHRAGSAWPGGGHS